MKINKMVFLLACCIPSLVIASDNNYRLSIDEMRQIANEKVFPNRIFYTKPSEGTHSAWFDAVKKGDYAKVKQMLENGQEIDVKDEAELGQTALGWAAFIGYEDIVKLLVEKGADLYATDRADVKHVFKSAIMGGHPNIINYIYDVMKGNFDINEIEPDGETMLIVTGYAGRLDSIKFLLDHGAKIDAVSEQRQQNALTYACAGDHQEVVDYLIEKGAVNFKTGKPSCDE